MRRLLALLTGLLMLTGILVASPAATVADPAPTSITIAGLDLHDGSFAHFGDTYYFYGTSYACGFNWKVANTPFCGFSVSTAPSLSGPWSTPKLLFSPNDIDPYTGTTWQVECGGTGAGCFNGRAIQRSGWGADDGVFIFAFNSPADWSRDHSNAYNMLGCNGPAGPCGPSAGAPHGSYTKPALSICTANGDFGFIQSATPGQAPALVCTTAGTTTLSIEQLGYWGVSGTGTGQRNVAGLTSVEGVGGWWDSASNQYVMTYSDPECGYCTGTGMGYATAPALFGTWSAPASLAAAGPVATGRRDVSATSCGGQPRTVSVIDGQPWQVIDLWHGTRNEATAATELVPLTYQDHGGVPGDGQSWTPPLSLTC